jgi:DNA-nicking Smr family endonuclease
MSRKPIQLADHGLWDEVKRTITPLTVKAAAASVPGHMAHAPHRATAAPTPRVKRRSSHEAPPPLAQMDRRMAQRLSRGQLEPDATLDLHGEGVETARMTLLHFLSGQRHRGNRLVLVITGKGASPFARHTLHGTSHFHTPEREGRLRREVPAWLHEEVFREHAVGFQPAHPRHGGGGAFYVRLRKSGSI